jgi:UDP-N-acetylmuramoyl-tripeptide--D-alanyl-D-alanine ligase
MGDRQWDILRQLATHQGRFQLMFSLFRRSRPFLIQAASFYRRTIIRRSRVAAIVGSFGKSTTTRTVITALGGDVGKIFEFNARGAVAFALLRIRPGTRYAAIEIGIKGPGDMSPQAKMIRPDITVVTCIGSEHNRSFKTLEATSEEKSKMVEALSPKGLAVLNGDDDHVMWMKSRTTARVITYGFGKRNDIRAENLSMQWPDGSRFMLHAGGKTYRVTVRLIGRHMIYTVLAAAAVAVGEGISLAQVIPSLESLSPLPGRMQPVALESGALLLRDDYKSSLETIETALDGLSEIDAHQKIVVLGEISEPPGSQGPLYRKIGEQLAKTATTVVLIGGKRAFEGYRSGLYRGGFPKQAIIHAKQSAAAAAAAVFKIAGPDDVVLIKGKGRQRLERVALALMGKNVYCDLSDCDRKASRCANCEKL